MAREYCANLENYLDMESLEIITITLVIPAVSGNYKLDLENINNVSINLSAQTDNGLYKLQYYDTIIKKTKNLAIISVKFYTDEYLSCVSLFRYSICTDTINIKRKSCANINNKCIINKYSGNAYISIAKHS